MAFEKEQKYQDKSHIVNGNPQISISLGSRSPELQGCQVSYFLAHLVMSLCNHALSGRVSPCRRCQCQCRRLCTALPVTGLIIEASCLTTICSYAPSNMHMKY